MRIAIVGCGWVGERLAKYLTSKKYHVIATTTSPEKIIPLKKIAPEVHLLNFNSTIDFGFLAAVDVAIFSMPISRNTWHQGFDKLKQEFPKTLFFSSTGVYPKENKIFTEEDTDDLRADIIASENLVKSQYPQTNILRFGGLMGDNRSLHTMFKNRTPENPGKLTNYIHYEDILPIVELFFKYEIKGETYNIVAPLHPSIAEILQLNNKKTVDQKERIISSEKLIQDFNYTFIHPNPKYF